MMFLVLRKLGNICCGYKMFLNKISSKHFLCPEHKICVRNKCCVCGQMGKHLCQQHCVLVCQGLNDYKRKAHIYYKVNALWNDHEYAPTINSGSRECLTFLHGICYKDLPYFPLNQDPHRNLEEEIHDEMKDTCEKKYAKSGNKVRHRPIIIIMMMMMMMMMMMIN